MKKVLQYIKLIRAKHWIKNGIVFIPVVFNRNFTASIITQSVLAFCSFCLLTSFIYVINDLFDIESDRKHPVKKERPLASGRIKTWQALTAACVCLTGSACMFIGITNTYALSIWIAYLALNVLYSRILKKIAIVDIVLIAVFYVLRVYYGAIAAGITISSWLFLTLITMSFYLGCGKRRGEIDAGDSSSREVLRFYNYQFLDRFMYVCLACAITFYSLWCKEMNSALLMASVPCLIVLVMRYSQLIENGSDGDPVEVVYGDKPLMSLGLLYVAIVAGALFWKSV
ncbi:MAG: UbiA prenyltransferase family protein [Treponema sp.]|jgi:4-hydroxybenzoate polyprenyltransferase|nr:UbiA prenyltransferase family protein [Treponema sp.]